MIKEFNSLEEIEKYYDEETNTYVFKESGQYINLVVFNFNLDVTANINACNIDACDIKARDINAWNIKARDINACNISACDINAWNIKARDINAWNINAWNINACNIDACDINACNIKARDINACNINADNISYYAVCFAHKNIKCKSVKGRRKNAKHFVLDGVLEVEE